MPAAIVDTGPLVAFLDRSERHHRWVAGRVEQLDTPLLLCEPVLTEAMYLLARYPNAQDGLLGLIENGALRMVSVHSRRGARADNLAHTFGDSSANANAFRPAAEDLVQMDENEAAAHGQQVSKIFHDADFIVKLDHNQPGFSEQIRRLCELMFGSNSLSPTRMEHGIVLAETPQST